MARKKLSLAATGLAVLLMTSAAWAAWCPPGTVPVDPAPLPKQTTQNECLGKATRTFSLDEESTQTIRLEKGKSYWAAANGCPRMGRIGISIMKNGKVLKHDVGTSPSFCFRADSSGEYVFKIKALSLVGSSTSGSIDACLSESRCGGK